MNYQEVQFICTAHHEAAHIAVAAAQGLRIRPEGFCMDTLGEGLACYCKYPDDSDLSREQIIIATFAGYMAQRKVCADLSLIDPNADNVLASRDWYEARVLLTGLSAAYFDGMSISQIQSNLEGRSAELVGRNWSVIRSLAKALLANE